MFSFINRVYNFIQGRDEKHVECIGMYILIDTNKLYSNLYVKFENNRKRFQNIFEIKNIIDLLIQKNV